MSVHSITMLFNVNVVRMRFRLNFSSFLDGIAAAAAAVFSIRFLFSLYLSFCVLCTVYFRPPLTMWCVLRHIVSDSIRPYNPVAFLPYSHVIVDDEGSGGGSGDGGRVCFFRIPSISPHSRRVVCGPCILCVFYLYS